MPTVMGLKAGVEMSTVGTSYRGDALIVRNEVPYDAEGVTSVVYAADEGSYVTKTTYDENGEALVVQTERAEFAIESIDGKTPHISIETVKYEVEFKKEEISKEEEISEKTELDKKEKSLIENGYKKVFNTIKIDFQYCNQSMKSKVQLQDIKDIGLLVYYDNPDYYELPLKEQREKLIDELNSYGFDFKYSDLGLDKLRTLYYGKEMYSENQNG